MRSARDLSFLAALSEVLGLGFTVGLLHAIAETTLLGWNGVRPTTLDLVIFVAAWVALFTALAMLAALAAVSPPLRTWLGATSSVASFRRVIWSALLAGYVFLFLKILSYWSGWGTTLKWGLAAAPLLAVAWLAMIRKGQRPLVMVCATALASATLCGLQLAQVESDLLGAMPFTLLPRLFGPALACLGVLAVAVLISRSGKPFEPVARAATPLAIIVAAWVIFWGGFRTEVSFAQSVNQPQRPASNPSRPNFLLIVLDTVRADHLDLFGYHRPTMPNLKRFAVEECQLAERIFTTAPWTLPSHASMFTGLYPSAHGAHYPFANDKNPTGLAYSMREDVPTLADFLASMGYQTAGISANYAMMSSFGVSRGFEHYDAAPGSYFYSGRSVWLYRLRLGSWPSAAEVFRDSFPDALQGRSVMFSLREPTYRRAREINARASDWLASHGDRPFFLFLNYMDAHDPYLPIPEDDERFVKRLPGNDWVGFPRELFNASIRREHEFGAEEIEFMRGQYDAGLVSLDRELGRLLDHLKSKGLLDNTWIFVTNDHGESFFEHGFPEHGNMLFQPEIGGFLLVKAPPAAAPIQPSPWMQAVDFFPTIADLLNEPLPASVQGSPWGRGRDYALSEVYCKSCAYEAYGPYKWPDEVHRDLVAVAMDDQKLIRSTNGPDEVYRFKIDPQESSPVPDPDPEFLRRAEEIIAARNKSLVEKPPEQAADKSLIERLRSLGYVQ